LSEIDLGCWSAGETIQTTPPSFKLLIVGLRIVGRDC